MIDFAEMTLAEARAYRDAYVAAIPERVAWLHREVTRTGGPADRLDETPASLVALWEWFLDWLETDGTAEGVEGRPPWYRQDRPSRYLSDDMLWMIDAVGCYLAQVIQESVPEARWDVFRGPDRARDIDQHRTMLHGLPQPVDPAQVVYSLVIGMELHGNEPNPSALTCIHGRVTGSA